MIVDSSPKKICLTAVIRIMDSTFVEMTRRINLMLIIF